MFLVDSIIDIQDMARGAVLLGTGGGGDPYVGELFVRAQIKLGNFPRIVASEDIDDDAFVLSIAAMGAPTVVIEHLVSDSTLLRLLARAEEHFGRRVDALISAEIGGANSMFPLALSAITGLPVLDADGIGRAVPHLEMTTFSINGCKATPAILMDDSGNEVIVQAVDDKTAEELCRVVTGAMGAMALGAFYPMSGRQAKEIAVQRTLTQTLDIGRAIRTAREQSRDIFASLIQVLEERDGRKAAILFDGKIVDVTHETRDGWHWGRATMRSLTDAGDEFTVDIQNEFTVARHNGRTAAIVPDLITILDRETGEPMTGEMLSYGQRVKVLGYAADAMLRLPNSLEVIGPRAFGIDEDFVSLEELVA
ncbi:DUF917 domain-containing protein [Sphingosinicella rhizophila]|uniref:DUF917 domain-containing protein n=1 Tax=Sphingosinicella rhizophila TaxID=3050082 RepID=A0ABU3Q9J3_9SPHN|nr:DUF917 domain-containing protein [Sphingosinicella sp. GR2756]MDT9600078.1 DUF917 domain-containing protein [Sphingosinicella sp. GR2756]